MRKHYTNILKAIFCEQLLHRRADLEISQEEMAHRLVMACRTYVDLEHGKTCCSALTLALFLIYLCADPLAFLKELQNAFENSDKRAA